MDWIISNDYPYRSDIPDLITSFDPPYPSSMLKCDGGVYPYSDIALMDTLSYPYPCSTYLWDGVTLGGYPYVTVSVDTVPVFVLPGPWMFVQESEEYPKLLIREAVPAIWDEPSDSDTDDSVTDLGQIDSEGYFTHPNLHRRIYTNPDEKIVRKYKLNIYGTCSWRTTETFIHDEESTDCEIP